MNRLRMRPSASGAVLLTALCGLVSAPPARAEEDVLKVSPPPGKALVFIVRGEREAVSARVPVLVNLVPVGELANRTFVTATVNPGKTHLRIGDRVLTILSFRAAANHSYFVRVEAIGGVRPVRTEARVVNESEGRRLLAQSRFVGAAPAAIVAAPRSRQPTQATDAGPPAAPGRISVSSEPAPASAFALIAYGGAFKIANGNQVVAGLATTYDVNSNSVFGVEAEWRSKGGIALGGEVFHYENDLVATGIPSGRQEVLAAMMNGKYYFHLGNGFFPFVGAGLGYAKATFSEGFTGKTQGPAYQGLAGLDFRFKQIGFYVQYKYLASTTGDPGKQVKVGGSGIVAGVSLAF